MSGYLAQELKARGTAQVIVILRAATGTGAAASASEGRRLAGHFSSAPVGRASMPSQRASECRRHPAGSSPTWGFSWARWTATALAALRSDPQVVSVGGAPALSPIRPPRVAAARLDEARTWGIERLGVPALWDQGLTGAGGPRRPPRHGRRRPSTRRCAGRWPTSPSSTGWAGRCSPPRSRHDSDEHGTHTAATIAGRPVGGRHVGVAPGAELASAIVIEGGDAVARVLGGMDWALGLGRARAEPVARLSRVVARLPRDHPHPAPEGRPAGLRRGQRVRRHEPVAGQLPPRRSPWGRAATDDQVADFSSSQRFDRKRDPVVPDLVAPGVGIVSAKPGGGYQEMDGTSMATPARRRPRRAAPAGEAERQGDPAREGNPRVVRAPEGNVRGTGGPGHPVRDEGPRGAVRKACRPARPGVV